MVIWVTQEERQILHFNFKPIVHSHIFSPIEHVASLEHSFVVLSRSGTLTTAEAVLGKEETKNLIFLAGFCFGLDSFLRFSKKLCLCAQEEEESEFRERPSE